MRYIIIGLGIYGSNLAVDLTRMGHEVIGADRDASIVEAIKDSISTAYILESIDESALMMLPLSSADVVIVAIGEDFGASVRTVALLKKAGVKHIYARAADALHESILEGFHVDRILTPEQHAAADLVWEIAIGSNVDSLRIAGDTYVFRFGAPAFFHGLRYSDLHLEKDYQLRLIGVSRNEDLTNMLGMNVTKARMLDLGADADARVGEGDILTVAGSIDAFRALCRAVS